MGALILFIFILILILTILIMGFIAYYKISKKAKEFSQMAFGTTDIKKGFQQLELEEERTPKSVSGMTSLMLPRITNDFNQFNFNEMKEKAEVILVSYLQCITNHSSLTDSSANSELKEQLDQYQKMLRNRGLTEHFDRVHIHQTAIRDYKNTAGRCIISFQTSLECYHYITNDSGTVTEGHKDRKYQTRFNMDMIYVQDRSITENEHDQALGLNCPNCGAPITALGSKTCAYCGSPILEINRNIWTFSNIEESR